jgi:DNA polymerase-3 subunit chi
MTKVDFHILPTFHETDRLNYVVRLVRKAQSQSLNILISVEDDDHLEQTSHALWAASPESFLVHEPIDEKFCSLQLSTSDQCGDHHQVLINLRKETPSFFSRFERVFEVVSQEPEILTASRARYRFYKNRGYALAQHDLRDRV